MSGINPHDAQVIRDGLEQFLTDAEALCAIIDGYENTAWNPAAMEIGNQLADIIVRINTLRGHLS